VEGASHKAVIVNLSLKGAYLSAKILPPSGSIITIVIPPPAVNKDLVFSGTVTRGTWVTSEQGRLGRFGIRFGITPPELMLLISKLYACN